MDIHQAAAGKHKDALNASKYTQKNNIVVQQLTVLQLKLVVWNSEFRMVNVISNHGFHIVTHCGINYFFKLN